jgi:hypothetical protein
MRLLLGISIVPVDVGFFALLRMTERFGAWFEERGAEFGG